VAQSSLNLCLVKRPAKKPGLRRVKNA